jgi:hypothetical protein
VSLNHNRSVTGNADINVRCWGSTGSTDAVFKKGIFDPTRKSVSGEMESSAG